MSVRSNPTSNSPLGESRRTSHQPRTTTPRVTSASTAATSRRDYLGALPASLAKVRKDATQSLAIAVVHKDDPGSKEETPCTASNADQDQDSPIDSQSKQRIDSILEGIIRGNNRTPDDHGELAQVKEKISEIEAAIRHLTEVLLQANRPAVIHRDQPGSEEAPSSGERSETPSEAHEEESPRTISELLYPDEEEEELTCVYCTAQKRPHRHNSSACVHFSRMTPEDQWRLVSQPMFCARCLHTTASHEANQCPVLEPELCTSCPVPHDKQLKCNDTTSLDRVLRTSKATKKMQEYAHAQEKGPFLIGVDQSRVEKERLGLRTDLCVVCSPEKMYDMKGTKYSVHDTAQCPIFPVFLKEEQWNLVFRYSLCPRCLQRTPFYPDAPRQACSCPHDLPVLCKGCPEPHIARLKCKNESPALTQETKAREPMMRFSDTSRERSFSYWGSESPADCAVTTKTCDGPIVPLSANAPEYIPQTGRLEPPIIALTQNPDLKPTAPVSADAEAQSDAVTCLYTVSPEARQGLAEPEIAHVDPSSNLDEDSDKEEDFEGTYCWYCEDMEDHEIANCSYLRDATTEMQRTYLQDTATCISCLELEEMNPQHLCDTSNICTSCNDQHHTILKCEVFPLTQTSEPATEA